MSPALASIQLIRLSKNLAPGIESVYSEKILFSVVLGVPASYVEPGLTIDWLLFDLISHLTTLYLCCTWYTTCVCTIDWSHLYVFVCSFVHVITKHFVYVYVLFKDLCEQAVYWMLPMHYLIIMLLNNIVIFVTSAESAHAILQLYMSFQGLIYNLVFCGLRR